MPHSYLSWKHTWKRVFDLLKNWRFWMLGLVGCFLFIPISVFASLWGVAFLTQTYHLASTSSATITSVLFIGSAISFPFSGWISDKIKSRRIPIFVGIVGVFVLSTILIYIPHLPLSVIITLLFFMGVFVGPQALIFAIAREMSPPRSTGISTAAANFIVTIGAAVFQPLIGYMLEVFLDGGQDINRRPPLQRTQLPIRPLDTTRCFNHCLFHHVRRTQNTLPTLPHATRRGKIPL